MTFATITFDCTLADKNPGAVRPPRLSTITVDITIDGADGELTFDTAKEILVRMATHFTNPKELDELAADLVRTSLQYAALEQPRRRLKAVK